MKKSMYFNYTKDVPLKNKAEAIAAAGFEGTELFRFFNDKEPLALQYQAATEAGLAVEAVHAGFCNTNDVWSKGKKGDEWLDFLLLCAKEQGELSVPTMVVHLSRTSFPPEYNEIGLNRFRTLCEAAKGYGVSIAFENLRRTDYLDYIMNNISIAGFCFDCGHEFLYNNGYGILEKYKDRLLCVHLHDNKGDIDSHLLPFDGTIEWEDMGQRLSETKLDFALAFEVFCSAKNYNEFPQEVLERAQRVEALINTKSEI